MAKKTKLKTVYKIKWKNLFKLLSSIIIVALLLFLTIITYQYYMDKLETKEIIDEINKKIVINPLVDDASTKTIPQDSKLSKFAPYWDYIKLGLLDVDMSTLKKINSSSIGYIEVKGTKFAYPIVEAKEDYYKTHSFNKKENSFGWIYLSSESNVEELGTNNVIYGNKLYSNILMNTLNEVFDKTWQEDDDNFVIKYSTNYYSTLWQIISIYKTSENTHTKTEFTNDEEIETFIKDSISKSEFRFKTNAQTTDKLLTLTTNSDKENIVVLAKLIKIKETKES